MTSSPCSSSIDEPINSSSFIPSFQSQQIYSTKFNNEDDNEESICSSKENYIPLTYYSDGTTTKNDNDNEYDIINNGIYSNTTMQTNEHFSYSSKI